MVHDANEYWFKATDKEKHYYFSSEAINENGVSSKTQVRKVE
jgi:xylan 1,4-beta-xylosidase